MKLYVKSNANTSNIYMLMDYQAGDSGMESDDFDCIAKFYATSEDDANQQLRRCKKLFSRRFKWLEGIGGNLYISEYNPYFDDESQMVYNSLEDVFKDIESNDGEEVY